MSRSVESRRLIEDSGRSGHMKKQTSSRTARVKFIPTETAIKMSSGEQKFEFPSRSKLDSSSVRIDAMQTTSRRSPAEFKLAPHKIPLRKVKEIYKNVPAGHFKLSRHGSEETKQTQGSKSCTKLKYKATHTEHEYQNLLNKEALATPWCTNFPGGNSCADNEPMKSISQVSGLQNILPKSEINVQAHPVLDATWCGSLEILDMVSCGQFYDGFRAHLLGKVHHKARQYSRLMPSLLRCTLLPCCNVWAKMFQNDSPTENDVALIFSPGDFERSKQQYFSLLGLLETKDMGLKTLINGVNLLIFSSKKLTLDSHGLETEAFLWGVYCPAKGHLASPPTSL